MQTKTVAMVLLIAIATTGAIAIGIGMVIQSVQGQNACFPSHHDLEDFGK